MSGRAARLGEDGGERRQAGFRQACVDRLLVPKTGEQRRVAHRHAHAGRLEVVAHLRERLELVVGRGESEADVLGTAGLAERFRERAPLGDRRKPQEPVGERGGRAGVVGVGDDDAVAVALRQQAHDGQPLESASRQDEDRGEAAAHGEASR